MTLLFEIQNTAILEVFFHHSNLRGQVFVFEGCWAFSYFKLGLWTEDTVQYFLENCFCINYFAFAFHTLLVLEISGISDIKCFNTETLRETLKCLAT